MRELNESTLILLGHGSTENEDSSAPTWEHAEVIARRGIFAEVIAAFWKEEPSYRDVLRMVQTPEAIIVPDFISQGYFTQEIIPRELELSGPVTERDGRTLYYCDPIGIHPTMTQLLLDHALDVAPEINPSETTLIIVGHGTGLNSNSTVAISDQAEKLRQASPFGTVIDAYMEEAPFVADWAKLAPHDTVVVVPFFIADGLHSYQDIPVLLGIETEPTEAASRREVFRRNPYSLCGKQLYYSRAIGTDPRIVDAILEQVESLRAQLTPTT